MTTESVPQAVTGHCGECAFWEPWNRHKACRSGDCQKLRTFAHGCVTAADKLRCRRDEANRCSVERDFGCVLFEPREPGLVAPAAVVPAAVPAGILVWLCRWAANAAGMRSTWVTRAYLPLPPFIGLELVVAESADPVRIETVAVNDAGAIICELAPLDYRDDDERKDETAEEWQTQLDYELPGWEKVSDDTNHMHRLMHTLE